MKENWLNENLCSFDEKVRVELGPQLIELPCTEQTLSDEVTAPHYKEGSPDALGRTIVKGEKMTCVDWRSKQAPKVWKIYQNVDGVFTKIDESEDKDTALEAARKIAKGI
ncbi:hypothetical protein [uncultured Paraglaciecola sp.]|uniref:hypothetical protein n=1 Tax=uncultured Paraglaciecola sp. TaxID=1765024 RepID=UPI00262CC049|nr:hypothetical protein [uncultured Paraglaciecola sp.]